MAFPAPRRSLCVAVLAACAAWVRGYDHGDAHGPYGHGEHGGHGDGHGGHTDGPRYKPEMMDFAGSFSKSKFSNILIYLIFCQVDLLVL